MSESTPTPLPGAEARASLPVVVKEGLDPSVARRRHTIFLSVTAAIVIAVIALAHSVLLPFVLALVIAYVLAPAVAWVERKRVPRALAIILVYVVVLGSFGVFIRLLTPRVAQELATFRR